MYYLFDQMNKGLDMPEKQFKLFGDAASEARRLAFESGRWAYVRRTNEGWSTSTKSLVENLQSENHPQNNVESYALDDDYISEFMNSNEGATYGLSPYDWEISMQWDATEGNHVAMDKYWAEHYWSNWHREPK